ncbi:hypothetical protein [Alteromonas lipolytica]|uniref:Uncharacterized protein n=1 Tax=Alteromonas lipolytica TaxID=1856405 RepID=A0A1E8FGY7_9ALTE|nr:hypothetical protein [Alteromonas lipolytica]OFI34723.1 hypothetical protein BFC17_14175 [Alteromonas lipolytica]GGF53485.1 hypothetical protein GCM10011338_02020 [Alteromonas lipolytica]
MEVPDLNSCMRKNIILIIWAALGCVFCGEVRANASALAEFTYTVGQLQSRCEVLNEVLVDVDRSKQLLDKRIELQLSPADSEQQDAINSLKAVQANLAILAKSFNQRYEQCQSALELSETELADQEFRLIDTRFADKVAAITTPRDITVEHQEYCSADERKVLCRARGEQIAKRIAAERGGEIAVSSVSKMSDFEIEEDLVISKSDSKLSDIDINTDFNETDSNERYWIIELTTLVAITPRETSLKELRDTITDQVLLDSGLQVKQAYLASMKTAAASDIDGYQDFLSIKAHISALLSAQVDAATRAINKQFFTQAQSLLTALTYANVDATRSNYQLLINEQPALASYPVFIQLQREIESTAITRAQYDSTEAQLKAYLESGITATKTDAFSLYHKLIALIPQHTRNASNLQRCIQAITNTFNTLSLKDSLELTNIGIDKLGIQEQLVEYKAMLLGKIEVQKKLALYRQLFLKSLNQERYFEPFEISALYYLNKIETLGVENNQYQQTKYLLLESIDRFIEEDGNQRTTAQQINVLSNLINFFTDIDTSYIVLLDRKQQHLQEEKNKKKKRPIVTGF